MSEGQRPVRAVNTFSFYVVLVLTFLLVVAIKTWWWPEVIPFDIFQFFFIKWDWQKLQEIPWFLMLVGPLLTLFVAALTTTGRAGSILVLEETAGNIATSIKAGVFEEASFRWIVFFLAIVTFSSLENLVRSLGANSAWLWITSNLWLSIPLILLALAGLNVFGLVAFAIVADNETDGCATKLIALIVILAVVVLDVVAFVTFFWSWTLWFYTLLVPFTDWITQAKLHQELYGYGWAVGAALVSVNWSFSEGHSYQGPQGIVNSWIFGMIMFWIMFNFGLPVAMLLHATYNVAIDVIRAGDAILELGDHARH